MQCCLYLAIALTLGCNRDDDTDPDSGSLDSGDTGTEQGDLLPTAFTIRGAFGYDAFTGGTHDYRWSVFDPPRSPWIELEVAQKHADTDQKVESCTIMVEHDGGPLATAVWRDWAGDTAGIDLWLAYELSSNSTVTSTCDDWRRPVWGADPAQRVQEFAWGLAIHAIRSELVVDSPDSLRNEVIDAEGQAAWDEDWWPYLLGGSVYSEVFRVTGAFPAGLATWGYSFAYVVDDDFVAVPGSTAENRQRYTRAEVVEAEAVPSAIYWIEGRVEFDPQLLVP